MTFVDKWARDPLRATSLEHFPYAKCAACGKDLIGTYFVYDRICGSCLYQNHNPVSKNKKRSKKRGLAK